MPRKSKKPLILAGVPEYLALHRRNPGEYPANVKSVAAHLGVSRDLFYKADPEIQALVTQIEEAHRERMEQMRNAPEPLQLTPTDQPHGGLGDDALANLIDRELKVAEWAAMEFLGRHKQAAGEIEQAPLTLDDLEQCLGKLSGARARLRPLVDEMLLRRRPVVDGDLFG